MPEIEVLRYQVLDEPLGLPLGRFSEGDADSQAIHMAAFFGLRAVGTVRLDPAANELWVVRRMAVHQDFERRSIGKMILGLAEQEAVRRGAACFELFSRLGPSENFYLKNGYKVVTGIPELPHGIPNMRMQKRI